MWKYWWCHVYIGWFSSSTGVSQSGLVLNTMKFIKLGHKFRYKIISRVTFQIVQPYPGVWSVISASRFSQLWKILKTSFLLTTFLCKNAVKPFYIFPLKGEWIFQSYYQLERRIVKIIVLFSLPFGKLLHLFVNMFSSLEVFLIQNECKPTWIFYSGLIRTLRDGWKRNHLSSG